MKEQIELIDFNATAHTISHIQDLIAEFKRLAPQSANARMVKSVVEFTDNDESPFIATKSVPQAAIFDLRQKLHHLIFKPFSACVQRYSDELTADDEQLQAIDHKSKELAAKPLENIEALTELSKQQKNIQSHMETLITLQTEKVSSLVAQLKTAIDQHNEQFPVIDDPLIAENMDLKGQLSDVMHRISEMELAKKQISEQLQKHQAQSEAAQGETEPYLTFDEVLSLMDSKSPALDMVKSILDCRADTVVPSDKLLKSLDDIKSFARPSELARYLLILTSHEFLGDYAEQGSAGAFKHFSKSTLSFKESETTMTSNQLRKQREFIFAGKKVLCEAHLKIGNNNTEQQQLRIHFMLDDGKVYLGYIGRHLPTGAQ